MYNYFIWKLLWPRICTKLSRHFFNGFHSFKYFSKKIHGNVMNSKGKKARNVQYTRVNIYSYKPWNIHPRRYLDVISAGHYRPYLYGHQTDQHLHLDTHAVGQGAGPTILILLAKNHKTFIFEYLLAPSYFLWFFRISGHFRG